MHTSKADVTDAVPVVVEMQVTYELCAAALGRFEKTVLEVLAAAPCVLVVDLSRCRGIDAEGIGMLLELHRQLRRGGSRLCVRGPSSPVRRAMREARVDQILNIVTAGPAEGERGRP